jgi:hypothetical protein
MGAAPRDGLLSNLGRRMEKTQLVPFNLRKGQKSIEWVHGVFVLITIVKETIRN